ncbi:hypothetical protein [Siphonobacter sp.]|uniref:hypothetical protein n=1 Tax=Siphonobacter sp. TaxID=1869184 RepID=UPI003B3B1620
MNLTIYKEYFEGLAKKKLFGHDPEQEIHRFNFLRSSIKSLHGLIQDLTALNLMVYEPRLQRRLEGGVFRDYYQCDFELYQRCDMDDEAMELAIKTEAQIKAGKLFFKVLHDFHEAYDTGAIFPIGQPVGDSFSGQYYAGAGDDNEVGFAFQMLIKADAGFNQPGTLIDSNDWLD